MKFNFLIFLFFVFCLGLASCTPDDPLPPDSEAPKLLSLHALVDNTQAVDFTAGNEGDYAFSFKYFPDTNTFKDSLFAFGSGIEDINSSTKGYFNFMVWNYKYPRGDYNHDLPETIKKRNYEYEHISTPYIPATARIEWVLNDSTAYFSDCASQTGGHFIISEVQDMVKDNVKYRKANIKFDCLIKNPRTGQVRSLKGDAVMAFPGDRI